MQAHTMNSV